MKKLLIVIDYQKDFVDGSLGFKEAQDLDDYITSLIKVVLYANSFKIHFWYVKLYRFLKV